MKYMQENENECIVVGGLAFENPGRRKSLLS